MKVKMALESRRIGVTSATHSDFGHEAVADHHVDAVRQRRGGGRQRLERERQVRIGEHDVLAAQRRAAPSAPSRPLPIVCDVLDQLDALGKVLRAELLCPPRSRRPTTISSARVPNTASRCARAFDCRNRSLLPLDCMQDDEGKRWPRRNDDGARS
jgi:hypothetical protein